MENGGAAVAAFCLRQYPAATTITVLCGKGNNGGDGFVAARRLALAGRNVRVILLGSVPDLKGVAATAFAYLSGRSNTLEIIEVNDEAALEAALEPTDLFIDAVVG